MCSTHSFRQAKTEQNCDRPLTADELMKLKTRSGDVKCPLCGSTRAFLTTGCETRIFCYDCRREATFR